MKENSNNGIEKSVGENKNTQPNATPIVDPAYRFRADQGILKVDACVSRMCRDCPGISLCEYLKRPG